MTDEVLQKRYDRAVAKFLEKLKAVFTNALRAIPVEKPHIVGGKYSSTRLVDAVMNSLQTWSNMDGGNACGYSPTEVRKYVLRHGYQPKGNHFDVAVSITLSRLAKSGKVTSSIRDGKRRYRIKK